MQWKFQGISIPEPPVQQENSQQGVQAWGCVSRPNTEMCTSLPSPKMSTLPYLWNYISIKFADSLHKTIFLMINVLIIIISYLVNAYYQCAEITIHTLCVLSHLYPQPLLMFFKWRNWSLERLSNLLEIT